MAKRKSYVAEELRKAAETYEERNAMYGDNYKKHGHILAVLFPNGVSLKTPEDFNRFGLMSAVIAKMGRYAAQFSNGGHEDSAHDASVYAQMLKEVDEEAKKCQDIKIKS